MFDDEDDAPEGAAGIGHNLAADQRLLLLIERIERLAEEKKGIGDDIKDVFSEAKATGYDPKTMRKLIADRKKSRDDLAEERAIYDTYAAAIGLMFE
jgi:uncharacterized protein (UPF0335 family)